MGGMGSGSWTRYQSSKGIAESRCAIKIQQLKKQNCLREGYSSIYSWSRNGEPSGSVGYSVKANGIQLNYRNRGSGQTEWENVELFIRFDYTDCNYGNQRTWLLCPHCHKRVAIVYSAGKYFVCRKCAQLNYRSQHENYFDRQLTKGQNIRQRLGGSRSICSPFPNKPKGMHWQTYWQLRRKVSQCEMISMESQIAFIERLTSRMEKIGQRLSKNN